MGFDTAPCIPIAQVDHTSMRCMGQAVCRPRHSRRGIESTSSVQSPLDWMALFPADLDNKNKAWHGDRTIPTKACEAWK